MQNFDTLICGGGVAGLTIALLLANGGLRPCVLDIATPPPPKAPNNGRTVAIFGSAFESLKACGIWPKLAPISAPLATMQIQDATNPVPAYDLRFEANELGLASFGHNIPLSALHRALYEAAQKHPNITLLYDTTLQNIDTHPAYISAQTTNNTHLQAPLLIGADGRNSPVRQYANIEATRRPYGQSAITCLINHTKPHNNTSIERHYSGGPFTLVPLPGNTSSVVWVDKTQKIDDLLKADKTTFTQHLQNHTQNMLRVIQLQTPPSAWPLEFLRSHAITAPRIALVAEAAHVISPLGAQGLNMSLRDIQSLADTINSAKQAGLDIGSTSTLARYARARMPDIKTRTRLINFGNASITAAKMPANALRARALQTLDNTKTLRKLAMHSMLCA